MKPGRLRKCACGECAYCLKLAQNARYYEAHAADICAQHRKRRVRRRPPPEVSDEEMDRRALAMGAGGGR